MDQDNLLDYALRFIERSIVLSAVLLLIGACGGPSVSPTTVATSAAVVPTSSSVAPTNTPQPPTATVAPPTATTLPSATATLLPPTATTMPSPTPLVTLSPTATLMPSPSATLMPPTAAAPISPTASAVVSPTATATVSQTTTTDLSALILTALKKNTTLTSYRMDALITLSVITSTLPVTPTTILKLQGERKGDDTHLQYAGGSAQPGELIKIGDKLYLRDQTNGAAPAKWFDVPTAQWGNYPIDSPLQIIPGLLGSSLKFTRTGGETLDGAQCDVYTQDRASVIAFFLVSIAGGVSIPPEQADKLFDRAESRVWVCADDYLHQLEMHVTTKPQSPSSQQNALDALLRIYDLNGNIEITAPADVVPLPSPTPVPTATPQPTDTPRPTIEPALATATVTAAQSQLQAVANWKVVLSDSFDSNANNWTTGSGKSVANGKYMWDINDRVNVYRGVPEMDNLSDFAATIDARLVGGSSDCGMGLTFRNSSDGGSTTDYVFYIHNDQRWGFDIIHSPDPGIAQNGTSDAIVPRALNRLLVIAQGRHLTFFVNGKYIGQAEDGTLTRGKIGAAVWVLGPGSCQVEFDNFQVSVPPTPTPTAQQGKILLADWTAANPNKWPTGSFQVQDASGTREIVGTKYVWKTNGYSEAEVLAAPAMAPLSDFDVSVDARQTAGSTKTKYGILFRQTDSNNEYIFSITGDGSYALSYYQDGEYHVLIFPKGSPAVSPGEVNRLRVVGSGSRFTLYVNGQDVAQVDDTTHAQGAVGVWVETYDKDNPGGSFEFSNFELRAP